MPFMTVKIGKGHSVEQKRALVQALTDSFVKTLGTKAEWVTINIEEFERENWATGGELHSDKHPNKTASHN